MLFVSAPIKTTLGIYGINVARTIPGPKGEFAGLIVATLDPEYFKTLMTSVLYAPDMWTAIAHGDGIQFLMVPSGTARPARIWHNRARSSPGTGTAARRPAS